MSDYSPIVDFASKDGLASGHADKVVKGTQIGAEFDSIETHMATKADAASGTHTGTTTMANLTLSGTFSGTIDGGTW